MTPHWMLRNVGAVERILGGKEYRRHSTGESAYALRLHDLLLAGFETGNFSPLAFHDEMPIVDQFSQLFRFVSSSARGDFRHATMLAIADWNYPAYRHSTFEELAYLAAYFRASECSGVLAAAFETLSDFPIFKEDEPKRFSAQATIVSVLQGLPPISDTTTAITRLFFRADLDPRLALHLLLGAVHSAPGHVGRLLERFFQLSDGVPGFFNIEQLAEELIGLVPMTTLLDMLVAMERSSQRDLIAIFLAGEPPLLRFEPSDASSFVVRDCFEREYRVTEREHIRLARWQIPRDDINDILADVAVYLRTSSVSAAPEDDLSLEIASPRPPRPELTTAFEREDGRTYEP